MSMDSDVANHYSRGSLLERLKTALTEDGAESGRPSIESLAPYDQFHGRGLEATEELAGLVTIGEGDHILDVGSGIGGPARYFAHRFRCRVTGIDLTREFCDVARELTRMLGLSQHVDFELGNALSMPFANSSFDGAYSMNVSMNIADKRAFYWEIHRVLKPGAWLVLSEVAKGADGDIDYPTPWAANARTSFLATPAETQTRLAEAGFDVIHFRSSLDQALAYGARSRALVARGEKPPHRAVMLIHGENAIAAMKNSARGLAEAKLLPIEILATKRR